MPTDPHAALIAALRQSLDDGTFVKVVLSRPAPAPPGAAAPPERAEGRRVALRAGPALSLVTRAGTRELTENHPLAQAADAVGAALGATWRHARVFTTAGDWEVRVNKKGVPALLRHPATFDAPPSARHDREKDYVLRKDAPFLRALGVVTEEGHVKSDKADKYKQIQHFVKILDDAADRAGLRGRTALRLADIGSGKAYLTFALWDWATHRLGAEVDVVGIERDPGLAARSEATARSLGCRGLRFVAGRAEDVELGALDVLVALHACDTATDDALHRGIAAGASLMLVVPCCQKEVRPQLRSPPEERALLRHDTFADRFSQMLTDGLRSLLVASRGYRAVVGEFVSDAHTHRNVMILASREGAPDPGKRAEADALAERYGIGALRLRALLDADAAP